MSFILNMKAIRMTLDQRNVRHPANEGHFHKIIAPKCPSWRNQRQQNDLLKINYSYESISGTSRIRQYFVEFIITNALQIGGTT